MTTRRLLAVICTAVLALGMTACSSGSDAGAAGQAHQTVSGAEMFPDVTKVEVTGEPGSLSFAVTMTSPYDTADRYADSMRVRSADGKDVYGENTLDHDHASEQPFTRSIVGVKVPDGVTEVVVEGHDQVSGWGGKTQTVKVPA